VTRIDVSLPRDVEDVRVLDFLTISAGPVQLLLTS